MGSVAGGGGVNQGVGDAANAGGVSDAQRIAFLKKFTKTSDFNKNSVVPLTAPEIAVPRRRSAEEGCRELGTGFLCFDLSRNIRCVNGKVTKNQVKPFDANFNLKACIVDAQNDIPGFCGGGASANPCVATAEQAVAGLKAGKEFFLEPAKAGDETVQGGGGGGSGDTLQNGGNNNNNQQAGGNNNNTPPPPAGGDPETLVPDLRKDVADASFCSDNFGDRPILDGTQIRNGSCSITVQGAIPKVENMVSTIIIAPENGAILNAEQPFTVTIRNLNIATGFFD
ncbi:hypothetical protein HDU67_006190, partial [Dinochytrium kinnereticum]